MVFLKKSEISIDKDSKRGYSDENTGILSINEVVDLDTSINLLTYTSLLFNLFLLMHSVSCHHIESKIYIVLN